MIIAMVTEQDWQFDTPAPLRESLGPKRYSWLRRTSDRMDIIKRWILKHNPTSIMPCEWPDVRYGPHGPIHEALVQ